MDEVAVSQSHELAHLFGPGACVANKRLTDTALALSRANRPLRASLRASCSILLFLEFLKDHRVVKTGEVRGQDASSARAFGAVSHPEL
jgi:hypothetical protein